MESGVKTAAGRSFWQEPVTDAPDRIVFESDLVRVGAFRCHPDHPQFHDSGPARNYCFVFPRTAVEIQHEHERPLAANPNVVTFYNKGQAYVRNMISREGDRCDWFGVHPDIARDVVRPFDPEAGWHPEWPFRLTRGWSDATTYLMQREIFERARAGGDPLVIEESVVYLLERVLGLAYRARAADPYRQLGTKQREIVHHVEVLLSRRWGRQLILRDLAGQCGMSVYHLCRLFRRATGTTLHRYRQNIHLRWALERVAESADSLVDIALDTGFSSHSHFTSTFRREFALTPSALRGRPGARF